MQVTTRSSYYKERWELLWAARVLKRTYSDGLNSIERNHPFLPGREPCHLGSQIMIGSEMSNVVLRKSQSGSVEVLFPLSSHHLCIEPRDRGLTLSAFAIYYRTTPTSCESISHQLLVFPIISAEYGRIYQDTWY